MKIFEKDGKMNFVDDKNVFVGFDYCQDCCESFGYFISKENKWEQDKENNASEFNLEGYNFDKKFYATGEAVADCFHAVFRLVKGKKELYLFIFNSHNGYYAHGFNFCKGETVIFEGSL